MYAVYLEGIYSGVLAVQLTIQERTDRQGRGGPRTLRSPRGTRSGECSTPVQSPSQWTPGRATTKHGGYLILGHEELDVTTLTARRHGVESNLLPGDPRLSLAV